MRITSVGSAGGACPNPTIALLDKARLELRDAEIRASSSSAIFGGQSTQIDVRSSWFSGNTEAAIQARGGTVTVERTEIRCAGGRRGTSNYGDAPGGVLPVRDTRVDGCASVGIEARAAAVVLRSVQVTGNATGIQAFADSSTDMGTPGDPGTNRT